MSLTREDLVEACQNALRKGRLSQEQVDQAFAAFDDNEHETVWQTLRELCRKTRCGYPVLQEVGEGASARVFKAIDRKRDRLVALKILRRSMGADPVQKARFRREAKQLSRLSHPNIVRVRAHGKREGKYYIVLDWVDGTDLHSKVEAEGPLSEDDLVRTGLQTTRALECAHRLGLIHRDVKPQNILLARNDELYLTDFGVARPEEPEAKLTRDGELLGTPEFISPEQAIGGEVDARSDLYSLGATLFYLATGRPPFEGISPFHIVAQHQHQPAPDPCELNPELDEGMALCILKCLEKDPEDRFESASDMLTALGRVMIGEPVQIELTRPVPKPAPKRRPKRKPAARPEPDRKLVWWLAAGGAAVVVLLIVMAIWL